MMVRMTSRKRLSVLLMLLFALVLFTGCAALDRLRDDPLQEAMNWSVDMKEYYKFIYDNVQDAMAVAAPEQRKLIIEKVNPKLNESKRALVSYSNLVLAWKRGGPMPGDLYAQQQAITTMLNAIMPALEALLD